MNEYIKELLASLNENQRNAVTIEENAVIAAGAGSGKTKVLAARYVYFIVEKNVSVETIIALTFTEKAAAEMHKRIYTELKKINHPNAKKAIEKFHLAKISTIDSFCNGIAKTASRNFGIAPNFNIDNSESDNLAYRLSLDFFLKYRTNESVQFFLGERGIKDFVSNLLVKLLTEYVLVSKPIDFKKSLAAQINYHSEQLKKTLSECASIFEFIKEEKQDDNFIKEASSFLSELPEFPEAVTDKSFIQLIDVVFKISSSRKGTKNETAKEIKARLKKINENLLSLHNFEYARKYLISFFDLLSELQDEYIYKKKQMGCLTFSDVARLAVDALTNDVNLRNFYKKNADIIMVDEFQDNNSLQKDLLFLIAEKFERAEKSIPCPKELCPNKLFFVGDEKQSIYAFRGADVSVFRKLSEDISTKEKLAATRLLINYRTEPKLINLFNDIFSKVFYSDTNRPLEGEVPAYEAEYIPTETRPAIEAVIPKMEIMLLDKHRFDILKDPAMFLSDVETEAFYIGKKILELYNSSFKIRDGKNCRPCKWSDFAVLLRASTRQSDYERIFRNLKIPYKSIQQKGLFNDAPINDIYSLLKLIVYPSDKKTYAQVLRSPFINIDDDAFAVLLLNFTKAFDISLAEKLNDANKQTYIKACDLFSRLNENILIMNSAEIITYLWYDEAYRYFLLSKIANYHYIDLYDYLFEIARQADAEGLTFLEFIDLLSSYIEEGEQLDNMEIPLDNEKDAVQFLTVHKSKGLEFPIVCIPNCGNRGVSIKKDGLVFYTEDIGPALHSPQDSSLSQQKNLIFESLRDEAKAKLLAETKRLLYVALTRAESYLILSGVENYLEDDGYFDDEDVYKDCRNISDIKNLIKLPKENGSKSFFDLLFPALPDNHEDIIFTEILPVKRDSSFSSFKNMQVENFEKKFAAFKVKEFNLAEKRINTVTGLAQQSYVKTWEKEIYSLTPIKAELEKNIKEETDKKEISAMELGTLAHNLIEARILNKAFVFPNRYSKKVKSEVETWAENFFISDIYKLAKNAEKLKSEYGFLTEYNGQLVSGQIDLIFKKDDIVYIVDYKTDELEIPENHRTQLSIYKKAAQDITNTALENIRSCKESKIIVKTFVFYLKTGHCMELC